jgi:DNA mismatch repair protein MutL
MPRIHRLPPELANQIAAGEVVERPASVVKELVENAIDAGARRVAIQIELGGKRLIRVEDDGMGMEEADARLALERHATSKIQRAEDLAAILTLGFRGEALPSIASVSELTLRTRARGAPAGTEIRVRAGVVDSVRTVGAPEGTRLEVADLFYNLPARRKFLKADSAEAAQVSRVVAQLALGYPEVGITLTSGPRTILQAPPVADPRDRFYQLYGERRDLIEVARETAGVRIVGYIAPLGEHGPARGPQNVFVNRRIVRDKTIAHAVLQAYSVATIKERSPEVHLFLTLPADRVDVNVHPTKAEVRFLEPSLVHDVLRRALAEAMGSGPPPALQFRLQGPTPSLAGARTPASDLLPGVLAGLAPFQGRLAGVARGAEAADPGLPAASGRQGSALAIVTSDTADTGGAPDGGVAPVTPSQAVVDLLRPMTPLGQFRNTYIVAVDADGICIIDQHVAHERVLFEQVIERVSAGQLASQRLLQPLLIDLAPAQRAALRAHAADLDRLGFDVEEFGGAAVRVSAVPAFLGIDAAAAAVRALAEDLEGFDRGSRIDEALRRVAATTACHAAVKANQPLTPEKIVHILDELRRTAYSSVCPHGRPVVLRLTRREIEKNFQRI